MIWWLPHILLIAWNIANAKHDSDRIKQHKKIYHGVNAALYIICVGLITYFSRANPYIFAASAIFGRLSYSTQASIFYVDSNGIMSPQNEKQ